MNQDITPTHPPLSTAVDADQTRRSGSPLLMVRDLHVTFPARSASTRRRSAIVHAVSGVSFDLYPGETLGLVGESGCGKTSTARSILRLIQAASGRVLFDGLDVLAASRAALRRVRRSMQLVFQDPHGSLDPRMNVGRIIGEPLSIHGVQRGRALRARVGELLDRVGLHAHDATRYPHEFSGGQRQRIGIARAIALNPKMIICDEPVSALDVSVQAQILNLLADLQRELGLTYLFIAHDLAVVRHVSDRVAVMYLGRLVEQATAEELFNRPLHPYTMALLWAIPVPDPRQRTERLRIRRSVLSSAEPPSPIQRPTGCAFHPRCPFATEVCRERTPALQPSTASPITHDATNNPTSTADHDTHFVACHHADSIPREFVPQR